MNASSPILDIKSLVKPLSEHSAVGLDLRVDAQRRTGSNPPQQVLDSEVELVLERDLLDAKIRERMAALGRSREIGTRTIIEEEIARLQTDQQLNEKAITQLTNRSWSDIALAIQQILKEESKDLELALVLTRALLEADGLAGFSAGISLCSELLLCFWQTLHPVTAAGRSASAEPPTDLTWLGPRLKLLGEFDGKLADCLRARALTRSQGEDGEDISLNTWDTAQEGAKDKSLDAVHRGGPTFIVAVESRPESFWTTCEQQLLGCEQALTTLEEVLKQRFPDSTKAKAADPLLKKTATAVKALTELVHQILLYRQPKQTAAAAGGSAPGTSGAASALPTGGLGAITNRTDALRYLGVVAQYFHTAEPYSPVGFLLDRAVEWGKMDLNTWLREVLSKEFSPALDRLRETLGIHVPPAG